MANHSSGHGQLGKGGDQTETSPAGEERLTPVQDGPCLPSSQETETKSLTSSLCPAVAFWSEDAQ